MAHNNQDIAEYHAGDALFIEVTVRNTNDEIVNLSNASAKWVLMEDPTDKDPLLEKTSEQGGITFPDDGTNGEMIVKVDTGDTADMNGVKHHRATVTDGDGDRATVFHGDFTIEV